MRIQTTHVLNGMVFKQAPQGGRGGDVTKVRDLFYVCGWSCGCRRGVWWLVALGNVVAI